MISLDYFRECVEIVPKIEAEDFRSMYVHNFVNTDSEWYRKYIQTKKMYLDGAFYSAYLWDCLKKPYCLVDFVEFKELLLTHKIVNVMWDVHSSEKIKIPDYWKFGRDATIQLASSDLIQGLEYLPEDIYIFDETFAWSLVTTHENKDSGRILYSITKK